nr:la-related protein 6C [Ipomoea batatas]
MSTIGDASERVSMIDDYVRRLEEEMRKIDAFKRELPLCMLLVNDAIVALKEEAVQCRRSRMEPVLEEFIPLKKSSDDDDDKIEARRERSSREKVDWMNSVQLWSSGNNHCLSSKNDLKLAIEEEENSSVTNDLLVSGKTMNPGKTSAVPGLLLGIPAREYMVIGGLSSMDCGSRAAASSTASSMATPKQIRELMKVEGLTNDEVKSHLQEMESVRGNDQGKKKMGGGSNSFLDRLPRSQFRDITTRIRSTRIGFMWVIKILFPFFDNKNVVLPQDHRKDDLPEEVRLKIIKQDSVAFPITSVASTKKIKSLLSNKPMQVLAQALRSSSKLNVSNDGKKVKRKQPFTDKDKEELQSRTVVAENLPDDHSHHNIEKIFNVVGSVKTIRVCHPQDSNSSASKGEHFISNKLHALIEFESPEIAEKAVERLNDEKNWRKGLRVKMLLRRSPKSVLKNRKSDFDGYLDDDELAEDTSQPIQPEPANDTNNIAEESSTASKKGWGKGRVKLRQQQSLSYSARGLLSASPQSNCHIQSEGPAKPIVKVPRMPDGTRGFTMGRGKPLGAAAPSSLSCVV